MSLVTTFESVMNKLTVLPFGLVLVFSSAAFAENRPGISFQLGAAVAVEPAYEGSKDNETRAKISGSFNHLTLRNGVTFSNDGKRALGLSLAPSFDYVAKREASDHRLLNGLPDVGATVEVGGKLTYATQQFDVFALARKGINGHKGNVAELGVDVYWHPNEKFMLTAGPRVTYGSERYMDTYFSVNQPAATASGLAVYDAESGLKSTGLEVNAQYQLNKDWSVVSELRYDRFKDRVTDSPIVQDSSALRAEIGLERRFDIRF